MSGVNKVIVVGRLGADPELKYTQSNQTVCRLSIATSQVWKDKEGQKQERTEWHRVVVWGQMGETSSKYLTKGREVYVEGRLQTRSWEDPQGNKKYTTEIVANTVQFLGSANTTQQTTPQAEATVEPTFDSSEDIPF